MSDHRKPAKLAEPYRRQGAAGPWDAIVIGSGLGGLATASFLARHGRRRVLVLERHYTIGGFTHSFRRPGYDWDVGIHYIGDTRPGGLTRALFDELTDGELEWEDMGEVVERIRLGANDYVYPRGEKALRDELVRRFPAEAGAIGQYFRLVHEACDSVQDFMATKAMPWVLGAIAKPFARRRFFRHSDRTTLEVLSGLTSNRELVGVLTAQWGTYGLPPSRSSFAMHALVTQHYFGGGAFPVGGAARIAETMAPGIRRAGGELLVGAEVEEIVVEGGRAVGVRMAEDGAVVRAPLVVSDAGVANTFGRLVPRPVAASLGLEAALAGMEPSVAHACLYVGLKGTARELGLQKANLWHYEGPDHEANAAMPDVTRPRFAYISFPSAKDPDFEARHPGRSTIDIMTFPPYEAFERWQGGRWQHRGQDYEALKDGIREGLLDILYSHLPQLRGAVDVAEVSTPLSTRHFAAHPHGEIYGLAHTPARFRNRWLKPATPLRGLMLTGADVVTGGIAAALLSGAVTASAVLRRNVLGAALQSAASLRKAA